MAGRVASSAGRLTALSHFYDVARRYGVYSPNRKTADERVTSRLQQHFDAALSAAEKDLEDRVEAGEWSRGEGVGPREAASAAELISSFSRMGAVLVEPKLLRVWQYLWAMAPSVGPRIYVRCRKGRHLGYHHCPFSTTALPLELRQKLRARGD